jgi:spore germination protein YaaH
MSTQQDERRKKMQERLSKNAEGWMPKPGDMVTGDITDIDFFTGDYGTYPILTIMDEETGDEIAVHCFHTVLKNEIAKKQPAVGDYCGIVYHGKKEGKRGGGSYESYRVRFERVTGFEEPKWDTMQKEARDEMQEQGIDSQTEATAPPEDDDIPFAPTGGPWEY